MRKLSEVGKIGILFCFIAISLIWGIYISYLIEPLEYFYFPLVATSIVLFVAMVAYWIYLLDEA